MRSAGVTVSEHSEHLAKWEFLWVSPIISGRGERQKLIMVDVASDATEEVVIFDALTCFDSPMPNQLALTDQGLCFKHTCSRNTNKKAAVMAVQPDWNRNNYKDIFLTLL